MTIKVNNKQIEMLANAVREKLDECRREAPAIPLTHGYDETRNWEELYAVLKSVLRRQWKQYRRRMGKLPRKIGPIQAMYEFEEWQRE
jgi:hypothetical protein